MGTDLFLNTATRLGACATLVKGFTPAQLVDAIFGCGADK